MLRIGREAKAFPFCQVRKQRGKQKWAYWLYKTDAVRNALAGRGLTAVASEWKAIGPPIQNEEDQTQRQPKKTRRKRAAEKHATWKALKADGYSFAQIAIIHEDNTGERVTEDAVKKALKRLKTAATISDL